MSGFVVGNEIVQFWTVLDNAWPAAPKSGLSAPGDVAFTLHRQSGSLMVSSAASIVFTEIGSTGHYSIAFTPENEGLYVLQLQEIAATTAQRRYRFPDMGVTASGVVFGATYTNAYCSEEDVERWSQLAFSSTSKPTASEVAAFAETRASELTSILATVNAIVTPDTVAVNTPEEDMLREANAIGAAADALLAKFLHEAPNLTQKTQALLDEYEKRVERLLKHGAATMAPGALRTHVTSGEVTPKEETTITDVGLRDAIRMDQEF